MEQRRAPAARAGLVIVTGLLVATCTTANPPQPVASPTQPDSVVQTDSSRAETPRDSFAVNPPGSDQWSVARIDPDGRTIWVVVPASPCEEAGPSSVTEADDTVHIDVTVIKPSPGTTCALSLVLLSYRVELDRPLDDRPLEGCGRSDCWTPGPEAGVGPPPPLGVDAVKSDILLAGVVGLRGDIDDGRPDVSGVARLDARSGEVVWATAYERPDAPDPLGAPAGLGQEIAVRLLASGGVAVLDGEDGTLQALVNGMDGSGGALPNGLWLDGQKVSDNVVALDLSTMDPIWTDGKPQNYQPALQWQITGESVIDTANPSSDRAVVVTQVRQDDRHPSAPEVMVRSADDGLSIGGGVMRDFTMLADARHDADGGVTAVGVAGPTLIAVDAMTGAARWQIRPEAMGFALADVHDLELFHDAVLVRTGTHLWALDPSDGSLLWQVGQPGEQHGYWGDGIEPVTQAGDRLLVAGNDGVVRAYGVADGTLLWESHMVTDQRYPKPGPSTLVVADGVVVVGIDDGAVAFVLGTGERLWSVTLSQVLQR